METLSSAPLKTPQEKALSSRSRMYGMLAAVFRYPDKTLREQVREGEFARAVADATAGLPYPFALGESEIEELHLPQLQNEEEIEIEFIRLFDAGPGKPACPLVEGLYRKDRKAIFKELILFYNNFGLSYAEGSMEDRPDHLCYEMEFLHYLTFLNLVHAQKGNDVKGYELAQRDFLARHPLKWLGETVKRIEEIEKGLKEGVSREVIRFYRHLIRLVHRFSQADYQYLQGVVAN